jgi:hypothetical protein
VQRQPRSREEEELHPTWFAGKENNRGSTQVEEIASSQGEERERRRREDQQEKGNGERNGERIDGLLIHCTLMTNQWPKKKHLFPTHPNSKIGI